MTVTHPDHDHVEAIRPRPTPGASPRPMPAAARPARWLIVGAAALGTLLVAAVVLLAIGYVDARADVDEQNRIDAARASALDAARTIASDLTNYNYRTIGRDFARAENDLTGTMKKQYTATAAVVNPTVTKYQTVSTSTLQAVAMQTIHENDAVVIALVDQTVRTLTSSTPQFDRNRMQLTMHRDAGGRWLASKVELI